MMFKEQSRSRTETPEELWRLRQLVWKNDRAESALGTYSINEYGDGLWYVYRPNEDEKLVVLDRETAMLQAQKDFEMKMKASLDRVTGTGGTK